MQPRETYTKKTLFLSQAPNFNFELNAEQILEKALDAGLVTKIGDDLYEGFVTKIGDDLYELMDITVNNFFATPETMEQLNNWIKATNDPAVVTAAMMMQNFIAANYTLTPKKSGESK